MTLEKDTDSNTAADRMRKQLTERPRRKVTPREDAVVPQKQSEIEPELDSFPTVSGSSNRPSEKSTTDIEQTKVVSINLHIPKSINTALKHLATEHDISRDSFVEASYSYLADHPDIMAAVIEIAKERHRLRREKGNMLRAKTMQQKYSF